MVTIAFLLPFVLLGTIVVFVAFSGGPSAAREAYLTRGNRGFKIVFPVLYILLGLVVPALILAAVNARGVTGPSLDRIGEVTPARIRTAIKNGGTGQGRMPVNLVEGEEA